MKLIKDQEAYTLRLNQAEYIDRILTRFNMVESNAKDTPMATWQAKKNTLEASKDNSVNRRSNAPYIAMSDACQELITLDEAYR